MGQVVIEIPQNVYRTYHVDDSEFGEQLLVDLKPFSNRQKPSAVIPPRRTDRKETLESVIGIWSDREETGQEIARRIRENNRRVT